MRASILGLLLGVSAFTIKENLHGLHDIKKVSCKLVEAAKDVSNDVKSSLYHQALVIDTESENQYLEIEGGQHAFNLFEEIEKEHPHPPKKGRKPHPPPHHGNPHDQRDKSIYEFIADSEYFTILHDIIKGDKHAVEELNKTSANLTLFAPTNRALEKYQKHAPPLDYLRKILLYHLLPDIYPAGRVLKSKTLETLYKEESLDQAQRLAVDINLRGLTLNYYARVIYIDIFTSNGVVHAIDNLLFPPPPIYDIAEILPSTFSTFINAAWKTGLVETLNETSHSTIFAPSNFAFATLGPRLNAYLFSTRGTRILTKLLKYHIVPDVLFYSDAVYTKDDHEAATLGGDGEVGTDGLVAHYEFDTALEDKQVSIDVGEWGRFKTIVFNGRTIGTSDIPAKNGVLQKLKNGVILPYKGDTGEQSVQEMSIEEFEGLFDGEPDGFRLHSAPSAEQKQEDEDEDDYEWLRELLSLF